MNMWKCILAVAIFSLQATIFSALPPLFEDIAEIKAILEDQKLGQMLESAESIKLIKKIDGGYLIFTNKHKLIVNINFTPISQPGPAQFEITFKKAIPIDYDRDN